MMPLVVRQTTALSRLLKCCFTSTETVGLLGTGAQDVHLDFHTAPELSPFSSSTGSFITPLACLYACLLWAVDGVMHVLGFVPAGSIP